MSQRRATEGSGAVGHSIFFLRIRLRLVTITTVERHHRLHQVVSLPFLLLPQPGQLVVESPPSLVLEVLLAVAKAALSSVPPPNVAVFLRGGEAPVDR